MAGSSDVSAAGSSGTARATNGFVPCVRRAPRAHSRRRSSPSSVGRRRRGGWRVPTIAAALKIPPRLPPDVIHATPCLAPANPACLFTSSVGRRGGGRRTLELKGIAGPPLDGRPPSVEHGTSLLAPCIEDSRRASPSPRPAPRSTVVRAQPHARSRNARRRVVRRGRARTRCPVGSEPAPFARRAVHRARAGIDVRDTADQERMRLDVHDKPISRGPRREAGAEES